MEYSLHFDPDDGAPHLNVMAGPSRARRFANHPDFDRIAKHDAG